MKILLTGANGYIGLRLLPELLELGHTVCAVVRNKNRLPSEDFAGSPGRLDVIEADLLSSDPEFPEDIDAAYYLIHSMGDGEGFAEREAVSARNFLRGLERTRCRQVIYLGGIIPPTEKLSDHLRSRLAVHDILRSGRVPLTALRASIIVGSGSASFEIIRDLVEKLPVMITPRWTANRCQPIAIHDVIVYLLGVLLRDETLGRTFDLGGPEVLTYKQMLVQYAHERKLRRLIIPVPVLTLRLSSLWLYMVANTSFRIARALVDSMVHESVCADNAIRAIVPQKLLTYEEAIARAFVRIAQNRVPSSWFDALASGGFPPARLRSIRVPEHGILRDQRIVPITGNREAVLDAIWRIGGDMGWPSMNWAWRLRGVMDRMAGGVGIRRGRRDPVNLRPGDAVDFWRVLLVDRAEGRLMLFAEMKLPGEAWLEFRVEETRLIQTATFRPRGLWGRLYWLLCMPFHGFLFPRMARHLASYGSPAACPSALDKR
ncbi:MAG: epimerase [Verrucomicrobia bacterium 61-8]|mgnify:CR=1 FL=1|nr:SDR family oxidoreductase [Verrucomicrobiota bacterium]OJU97959.1 MAG: epimerase [Verrucomicrobia bacterium 61-8]